MYESRGRPVKLQSKKNDVSNARRVRWLGRGIGDARFEDTESSFVDRSRKDNVVPVGRVERCVQSGTEERNLL
jgi:hypothetical protein